MSNYPVTLTTVTVVLNCPTSEEIETKLLSHYAVVEITFKLERAWIYMITVSSILADDYIKWVKKQDYVNDASKPGKVKGC